MLLHSFVTPVRSFALRLYPILDVERELECLNTRSSFVPLRVLRVSRSFVVEGFVLVVRGISWGRIRNTNVVVGMGVPVSAPALTAADASSQGWSESGRGP